MNDPRQALEDRLVDLEIRFSHQDAAIEELTRLLLERDREIRQLSARVDTLEQQLRSMSSPDLAAPQEETPPPHF